MAFSHSNGVITQTGTDTDFSGLSGLSGVTTSTSNGKSIYDLNDRQLVIAGTISHNPETEELFFRNYQAEIAMEITGTYTLGEQNATTGKYSSGTALRFARSSDSNYLEAQSDVYIDTSGTMEWYGGVIHSDRQFTNYGTWNTYSKEAKLIAYTNIRKNIRQRGVCNIDGFVSSDYIFGVIVNPVKLSNWEPYSQVEKAFNISTSFPDNVYAVAENFNPSGLAGEHTNFWQDKWGRFINCFTGSDLNIRGLQINDVNNKGLFEVRQKTRLQYFDTNLNSLDGVKVSMTDTNNGTRLGANQINNNVSYTADRTYTGASVNGEVYFDSDGGILVAVHWRNVGGANGTYLSGNNKVDYRGLTNNSNDNFTFNSCDYLFQIASSTKALKGVNGENIKVFMIPDFSITESTKATVDAYTSIDNSFQLYDRAKSYLYDNYAGESTTIVTRDGNQINIGSKDLNIDGTASSVFAYSTDITIKSSEFVDGITGSGTVNVLNGALLNGGDFDSDIDYQTGPSTITDVTANNLNFSTSGTYNLVGCNVSNVTNSSGGNVTLVIDAQSNITTNSGPNITIQAPETVINFNNLEAGSQLVIYDTGTTTELYRVNSTSTSEQYTNPLSVNFDYTVQKAGFFPVRQTGLSATSAAPTNIIVQQILDRAYVASTGLTNSNVTVNTTAKTIDITTATTVQNAYSYLIEAFINESSLRNIEFPVSTFGSASFSLDLDYEFTSSTISNLSRDGFRYTNSGNVKAIYAAILSQGVVSGLQAEYVQTQGGTVIDAQNTGNVDQVIKIFGDANNGNFDYRNHLVFKVQANGYRQVEFDVINTYGTLEANFYVIGLNTLAIDGLTLGDPTITGITVTDNTASPVSWDAGDGAKDYSLTITDTNNNSGEDILRHFNYLLSTDNTLNGLDVFQYPELILDNGSAYETVRGIFRKSTGDATVGVRVIDGSGNPHPDFTRFQSDDGTYGVVPVLASISVTNIESGSRLRIYNETTSTEIYNNIVNSTFYNDTYVNGVGITDGDLLNIRLVYQVGTSAKLPFQSNVVATVNGFSVLADQQDDEIYNTIGLDGSLITEFDNDFQNNELDIVVATNFSAHRLYNRYVHFTTLEDGIRLFFGAVTALDIGNFRNNVDILDMYLNNNTSTNLVQTDNVRLFKSDGTYPARTNTTGGGGVDVVWRNTILIAETGVSGLTAQESAKLNELDKIDGIDKRTKLIPASL